MKLKLHITAKPFSKTTRYKQELNFAVIDLDKAKNYPENFVCILPKLTPNTKASSTFYLMFKDQSLQVAKSLLTKALKSEDNLNVKVEIEQRLRALQPKPTSKAKCMRCGKSFEPKTFGRYQQKICQTCKNKPINQRLAQ
jgi:DNA-directed RNA polymerase subunit RPC12/RpoP